MARGRRLESLEDFKKALKQLYGLGEGFHYKPWLRVQDVKSRGRSSKIHGIKTGRDHHTLSDLESQFFILAEFSDIVIDIREQFPLVPLELSVKIAKEIGIEHPIIPKTKELNVITTDFLLTCSYEGKTWYEAINIKPEDDLNKQRILEKIDIERIWWDLLGINFLEFVSSEETKVQSENIAWATDPVRHGFRNKFEPDAADTALSLIKTGRQFQDHICDSFVASLKISHRDALNLLKILISDKKIEVDLSMPMVDSGMIDIVSIVDYDAEIINVH